MLSMPTATALPTAVVIRPAVAGDHDALTDLAKLDSAAPLHGDVLLAERDGHVVAALELSTDRAVADPFERTAADVSLLRTRARTATRRRRARRGPALRARLA